MPDKSNYPPLKEKDLPRPPHWSRALGVGVVVMGLAIGTGELIMWPNLTVRFGLSILWGAFIGILFQYFINREVARLSIATGESFFTTSSRILSYLAPFWLISAFILYIWPGWAGAIGTSLTALTGLGNHILWAWASLILVLLLTLKGRVAYKVLEKGLMITVPLFFILLVTISIQNLAWQDLAKGAAGLFSIGWLPDDIDIPMFLAAVVFAGAGGLLNLAVSLWYRDKQFGMGSYIGRITNPITGKQEAVPATGFTFKPNERNIKNFKGWMRLVDIDQGLIFFCLGLLTLFLLSLNSYVVLKPKGLVPEGLQVAVVQANIFGEKWGIWGYNLFLFMTSLMLFSVMWALLDAFTRIVSDIIYVNSKSGPLKKYFSFAKNLSLSSLYYILITTIVFSGIILLPFNTPLIFLKVSAVLAGAVMALYTPILAYAVNTKLPKEVRPSLITNIALVSASVFYLVFSVLILKARLFP